MRKGEKHFFSSDHDDRLLMIGNNLLTAVSIILTVIDIVIKAMSGH